MEKTTNYQLKKWDKQDRILMQDFNDNSDAIDAALAALERRMAGMICAWSGAADAIPAGWLLCDGSNGTPDLRGRFILGAGSSYAPGAAGGEASHTLSTAELPRHSHNVTTAQSDDSTGSYLYRATTTVSKPNTSTCATSTTGSGQAHNNMPPYYALCFVMYQGKAAQ